MSVEFVLILGACILSYFVSLGIHPYTRCRACHGSNKHFGAVFNYAYRPCRRCKGTGRKLRFGCKVVRPGITR